MAMAVNNLCYGVMFHNAAEKDDEQLQAMLQEFGKIEEVLRGGVNAFVYFKEYSAARDCIHIFSKHPIYQAKPDRRRETITVFNRESRPFNAGNSSQSESRPCCSYESSKKEYPGEYKTFDEKFRNLTINQSREGFSLGSQSPPVKKFPENPPHLISATDLWESQQREQVFCPATVAVTNLPVSATYVDLFQLCSTFVRVCDMEIVKRERKELPRYAKIGTGSWEEAEILVNNLHNHKFMGKTLKAEIIEKIISKT